MCVCTCTNLKTFVAICIYFVFFVYKNLATGFVKSKCDLYLNLDQELGDENVPNINSYLKFVVCLVIPLQNRSFVLPFCHL